MSRSHSRAMLPRIANRSPGHELAPNWVRSVIFSLRPLLFPADASRTGQAASRLRARRSTSPASCAFPVKIAHDEIAIPRKPVELNAKKYRRRRVCRNSFCALLHTIAIRSSLQRKPKQSESAPGWNHSSANRLPLSAGCMPTGKMRPSSPMSPTRTLFGIPPNLSQVVRAPPSSQTRTAATPATSRSSTEDRAQRTN